MSYTNMRTEQNEPLNLEKGSSLHTPVHVLPNQHLVGKHFVRKPFSNY